MQVTLTLVLEIDDSGEPERAEEIMHENLGYLVDHAMGNGLITGDSDLLVEGYQSTVHVIK